MIDKLLHWTYCLDIPDAVLLIGAVTLGFLCLHRQFGGRAWWKLLLSLVLACWAMVAVYTTITARDGTTQQVICNMTLFHSYREVLSGGTRETLRSNFMNVVLFYPGGLIAACLFPRKWPGWVRMAVAVIGLGAMSVGIEYVQYHFALGRCEIDDVLHNTLGAMLGSICAMAPRQKKTAHGRIGETDLKTTTDLFLELLKTALGNEQLRIDRDIPESQWQELFRMASIHNVLPLVYEAVYRHPSLACRQELLASVKRQVRQQVIMQTIRTGEFLELNDRLRSAGIRPLVVKGILCRSLYPQPDHRPSSDEDVLIPPEQFADCHRILTDFGMETGTNPEELSASYEVPYRKEGSSLYIELHKHLFPPESDAYGDINGFFADVRERAVAVEIQGHTVYTLGYSDHLFYLICHAFKHFLHSGFGIRQVCDIVIYANAYGPQVDWMGLLENCRAIRADKFAAALFQIGSKHLIFDPEKAAYPQIWQDIRVNELPMLEDLLSGGLYGAANMSRKHSSNITLDAVSSQKAGRKARGALAASVFPAAASLEGRYPYLKRHPYLLPAAWCSRLWEYGRETRNSRSNRAADALKIGNERIELLKIYGILQ